MLVSHQEELAAISQASWGTASSACLAELPVPTGTGRTHYLMNSEEFK